MRRSVVLPARRGQAGASGKTERKGESGGKNAGKGAGMGKSFHEFLLFR
jgi:hypothetical protein